MHIFEGCSANLIVVVLELPKDVEFMGSRRNLEADDSGLGSVCACGCELRRAASSQRELFGLWMLAAAPCCSGGVIVYNVQNQCVEFDTTTNPSLQITQLSQQTLTPKLKLRTAQAAENLLKQVTSP